MKLCNLFKPKSKIFNVIAGKPCPDCDADAIFFYHFQNRDPFYICEKCNKRFTVGEYTKLHDHGRPPQEAAL